MAIPVIQTGFTEWTSTAAVTNIPLDKCTGIQVGDLLLLIVGNEDSTSTPQFTDNVTGFDLEFEIGDGVSDNHLAVYTRIADGTEAATTNVGTQSSDYAYGWYLRITGAHPTIFWDGHTSGVLQSSLPIDVTGRNTTVDDCLAFVFAGMDGADGGAGTVAGTGWSKWRSLTSVGGSSGAAGVVGTKDMATAGPTGTATCDWSVSDGSAGIQFAIAPAAGAFIASVTPEEFDDDETGIVIGGSTFEASQGTGKVELSDNAVYATGTKVGQTVTSWGDTSITITCDLSTLGPGTRWLWVTNDSAELSNGFEVTVHRAHAIRMIASTNIGVSGENTTFQLEAPATKTTADFGGGRIQDDENPTDNVDIALDEYREDEWCFEGMTAAEEAQYEFRVTLAGTPIDTYTQTPKVTFSAGVTLVIADALHSTTDDGPFALTQHHTLVVDEALHSTTDDGPITLTQHHVLVIAEADHATTDDGPIDLVHHHILAIAEALHSTTDDGPVDLVQHHVLAVDEADHATTDDGPIDLIQHHVLAVDEAAHATTDDGPITLTTSTTTVLVIEDAAHSTTDDGPVALTQHHVLAVDEADHATTDDGPIDLTQHHVLAVDEAAHATTDDGPVTLSVTHTLEIAEAAHTTTDDGPFALTQHHVLTVADAIHGHAADNLDLVVEGALDIQEATHATTDDGPIDLTQHHVLAVNDATHSHTAESLDLTEHQTLAIDEAIHALTDDGPITLTQHHVLTIAEAIHSHTADNMVLTVPGALTIQEATHATTDDGPITLIQHHVLAVNDATHSTTDDGPFALVQHHVLSVADSIHATTDDGPITLTSRYVLSIADGAHGVTDDGPITLTQVHVLGVDDAIHGHTADNVVLVYVGDWYDYQEIQASIAKPIIATRGAAVKGETAPTIQVRRKIYRR